MKNKTLRILSLAAVPLAASASSMPAFAYNLDENGNSIEMEEYQNSEESTYTNSANVFAEIGSEYKVTIPKVVVLSGTSKAASYYVKVAGDIAGYEKVTVTPDDNFKLYASGKDSQEATINQDKTTWRVSDFDTDANGTISAPTITAGKWTGAFNFNINLESNYEEIPQTLEAGLYDLDNNLIKSWAELLDMGLDIEKDCSVNDATNSGTTILRSNNLTGKLVLPNTVTKIGNYNLAYSFLDEIVISDSVQTIGKEAFQGARLKKVTLGKNVKTIDENAFASNDFETINLPNTLETIGDYAFYINDLTEVVIPNSVTNIGAKAFSGCEKLKKVTLPDSISTISLSTFAGSNVEEINIPESVKTIEKDAFAGNSNLKVIVPVSVEEVQESAFGGVDTVTYDGTLNTSKWGAVNIISSTTVPGAYNENGTLIKSWDELVAMGLNVEANYDKNDLSMLGSTILSTIGEPVKIVLPNTVTKIGNSNFAGCRYLKEIVISDSVETIGTSAFASTSLEKLTLGKSLKTIGDSAFAANRSLNEIRNLNVVETIGSGAFTYCQSLNYINNLSNVKTIGAQAFAGCSNLEIVIPNTVEKVDSAAFGGVKHVIYNGNLPTTSWGASKIN